MLYSVERTVQDIKFLNSWFWKMQRNGEPEYPVHRMARLLEVPQSFVNKVLAGKIHADIEAKCNFPCMQRSAHAQECLTYRSELPEDLQVSPSPAEMELLEVDNQEMMEEEVNE